MDTEPENIREDIGYKTEHHPESGPAIQAALGRTASPEIGPHKVPQNEDGFYIIDEIKPGMFIPGWGPVKGSPPLPSDPDIDIATHANLIGRRPLQRFRAAQHFARLQNKEKETREKLIQLRDAGKSMEELALRADYYEEVKKDISDWIRHSEEMAWKDSD